MSSTTIEQVVVGKMSLTGTAGQFSIFALPKSFAWLKHFNSEELAEFFAELMDAMYQSQRDGDWSSVADVIENWKATASIEADPAVVAGIEQGLAELEEGQGISWTELRAELDLWGGRVLAP
jgi:hypothetical protein